jgi:hypothetical protein
MNNHDQAPMTASDTTMAATNRHLERGVMLHDLGTVTNAKPRAAGAVSREGNISSEGTVASARASESKWKRFDSRTPLFPGWRNASTQVTQSSPPAHSMAQKWQIKRPQFEQHTDAARSS